jgi:gliding motility-associated-like protein
MVKIALTAIFFSITLFSIGQQNLVPNPSFEVHTSCPDSPGDIQLATPWFQPSILNSSTDLFDECATISLLSVPFNGGGFQYARSGASYSGIVVWENGLEVREYIEVKLTEPLQKDKTYCVEFYVSLSDTSNYGISNIGAYFSADSIFHDPNITPVLPFVPQVNNTNGPILEKNNWVLVNGTFIANGQEQLLTIGNFSTNSNTSYQFIGDPGDVDGAYYYIDDVSVRCCNENNCEASIDSIPNVFTPNGDDVNDVFLIKGTGFESMQCDIYNRWGIKVATISRVGEGWDGRTTSGQEAVEGVYYYIVSAKGTDGKEFSRKGFIQLLR